MKKSNIWTKFKFVLTDKVTGKFPKIGMNLVSQKLMTSSLGETYVFDERDNPEIKKAYYNALYKGIAEFEIFKF